MSWRLHFHHIMDGMTNFSEMHFILKYKMVFVQKIFVQKSREVSDENKWNDVVKLSIYSNIQQNPFFENKIPVSYKKANSMQLVVVSKKLVSCYRRATTTLEWIGWHPFFFFQVIPLNIFPSHIFYRVVKVMLK